MKSKLSKKNYTEYIDYLKDNNINFNQNIKDGFLSGQEVEVIPISDSKIPRSFDVESQKQIKESHPKKKTRLDFMDYTEFMEYLNKRNIKYEESRYFDIMLFDIIDVTPISKKLKGRIFSENDGDQFFEGDYVD